MRGLLAMAVLAGTPAGAEARFEDWPATAALPTGAALALPDFEGRDAWARSFRTGIRSEMEGGPDFAGRWSLIQIGCGTGCSRVYLGDHATGEVLPFPYGEYAMSLSHDVGSRLVRVSWWEGEGCVGHDLVWDGARFARLAEERYAPRDFSCER